jgi:hypothetical protein
MRPSLLALGFTSYSEVLANEFAQTVQKCLQIMKTLVFVGFGAGLHDPDFGQLLTWAAATRSKSQYRNFRLARSGDVQSLQDAHDPNDRIFVVSYGAEYDDLTANGKTAARCGSQAA